jgi:hypothetical protein
MKTKGGPWAAEEDAVVLTMDARAAAKKLGRTYGAVNTRRHTLRHPEPKPTNLGARWTAKELSPDSGRVEGPPLQSSIAERGGGNVRTTPVPILLSAGRLCQHKLLCRLA